MERFKNENILCMVAMLPKISFRGLEHSKKRSTGLIRGLVLYQSGLMNEAKLYSKFPIHFYLYPL